MNIDEIQEDLSLNLKELFEIESNKLLLWASIYQRSCNDLIEDKLKKLEQYLMEQIELYGINPEKYQDKINEILNQYKEKMQRIIDQYNSEYIYIQNEIALFQNNQKITIANFISSKRGEINASSINNEMLEKKTNKKVYATAQKKLNYDVVIDECSHRLEKCMEDSINAINEIFVIRNNQITKNSNNLFAKIKRFFNFSFKGEAKFNKYIIKQIELTFKNIENRTVSKISDVKLELISFISQINRIYDDINMDFNQSLNQI